MTDKSQQRERFDHLWNERYPEMPQWSDAFIFDGGKKLMDEAWSWYQLALSQPAVAGAVDDVFIEDFRIWACKAAQLMDGFQHDEVWSDWDREVRRELSGLIVRAEALRTASPSQPAASEDKQS